jgi:GT2 family glycosyltransferase
MLPKYSILIATANRINELKFTLTKLLNTVNLEECEILVISDNCRDTEELDKTEYFGVKWFHINKKVGASHARNILFKHAKGKYLIGLDDDAHLITTKPLVQIERIFQEFPSAGIIAFKEFRVVGIDDTLEKPYCIKVNDFVGCGFCIRKDIYDLTSGFPLWIDIYGEESCLALEVLSLGYDIIYSNRIAVHHRVNKVLREQAGHNIFRFKKSLLNSNKYFIVYYPLILLPNPLIKLFFHNLLKYGLRNSSFFIAFIITYLKLLHQLPAILKHRKPVSVSLIKLKKSLAAVPY